MEIRKARGSDVPAILRLWEKLMKYELGLEGMHEAFRHKPGAKNIFEKYLRKCIRSRNCLVLVAVDSGKTVAYSLNKINKNIAIFAEEKLGYLSDLYVEDAYRREGTATIFKEMAFDWFRKRGIKYATIRVYDVNKKAHDIYRDGWGFRDYHIELIRKISTQASRKSSAPS